MLGKPYLWRYSCLLHLMTCFQLSGTFFAYISERFLKWCSGSGLISHLMRLSIIRIEMPSQPLRISKSNHNISFLKWNLTVPPWSNDLIKSSILTYRENILFENIFMILIWLEKLTVRKQQRWLLSQRVLSQSLTNLKKTFSTGSSFESLLW